MARLTFDETVILPLFFGVCHASTGEEMATYVFNNLKQMISFSKLGCVTTDRANNMVGKETGWCFISRTSFAEKSQNTMATSSRSGASHRLNLVVRAFESVDNASNVLKFANWFSGRRKAVAY